MHNAQTGNEIEKYEKPELKECGTIKENTNNYTGSGSTDNGSWS